MPRGGRRPGAGRKPARGVLIGMDGSRREAPLPPAVPLDVRKGLAEAPDGLLEAAKSCWNELAPRALEERTLTPATVAGFAELCVRLANVRALDARIAILGIASTEALPYLKERRGQGAALSSSLKDFKLSAFGKPSTAEAPKSANPWAAIAQSGGL